MNKNKEIVSCALDIGSSQIKAAVGRYNKNESIFEILATESASPSGAKGGVVADITTCSQAIAKVLEGVESKTGLTFHRLFLAISNSQINLEFAKGACLLEKEKRITNREVERAINSSIELYLPLKRKLIQVIAKEYIVDGQRGILNPIGMFGRKLEVQTILLHSPSQVISNLIMAIEEAGYTVNELIALPQAQAEFLLNSHEKETQAILLDIGEQTVNFSYFKDKFISEVRNFAVGVGEITKEISSIFNIPYNQARALLESHLSLSSRVERSNEKILLKRENGEFESILKRDFCLKGGEASKEIFAIIEKCLKKHAKVVNVILLGGATLIDGFLEKLEEHNFNLRMGSLSSERIKFSRTSFDDPLFLNSICACAYGFKLLNERRLTRLKDRPILSRLFLQIKDLIEEYF
jgi:cell division protein FtsA